MTTLLSFARPPLHGWSNDEKAQFARIQNVLGNAGVAIDIEHGLTDEGEPWCVLCSSTTGDVIIHVARIDGRYLFDSSALPRTIEGNSLDDCAKRFIDDATVLTPRARHGSKIMLHPSAMLAGVMLTIFLYLEAIGESSAYGRERIMLGPDSHERPEETGEDAVEAPGKGEEEEDQSALFVLRQMLQQIAEAQKVEADRTGAQNGTIAQGWSAFLPAAAVVVAIAYVQENAFGGSGPEDELLVSGVAVEAETGEEVPLPEVVADAQGTDAAAEAATVVETADGEDAVEVNTVEAAWADIPLVAPREVTFKNTHDYLELVTAAIVTADEAVIDGDWMAVATEEGEPLPVENGGDAPVALTTFAEGGLPPVSWLVQMIADGSVTIRDEVFDLGDFIEIHEAEPLAIPQGEPGLFVDMAQPVPMPGLVLRPVVPDDTLVFAPFELASREQIAEQIRDFVGITGMLRFDMSDRNNQVVYDRSIIGLEDDPTLASRSFSLQDDSIFTFVGYGHELDMLFG